MTGLDDFVYWAGITAATIGFIAALLSISLSVDGLMTLAYVGWAITVICIVILMTYL